MPFPPGNAAQLAQVNDCHVAALATQLDGIGAKCLVLIPRPKIRLVQRARRNLGEEQRLSNDKISIAGGATGIGLGLTERFPQDKEHRDCLRTKGVRLDEVVRQASCRHSPADLAEVPLSNGCLGPVRYPGLYERRLLPVFKHVNDIAKALGRQAFIIIPGLGCRQFASPFRGQLRAAMQAVLGKYLARLRLRPKAQDLKTQEKKIRPNDNNFGFSATLAMRGATFFNLNVPKGQGEYCMNLATVPVRSEYTRTWLPRLAAGRGCVPPAAVPMRGDCKRAPARRNLRAWPPLGTRPSAQLRTAVPPQ